MRGFIIDRGFSPFDGDPYVAILTLKSSNRKTGDMAQVYIIRPDVHPVDAINSGNDAAICGDCPHRRKWNTAEGKYTRSCYVNVAQSVQSVYKAYKRGAYTDITDCASATELVSRLLSFKVKLSKLRIRWGAYGDPAMINPKVVRWFNLISVAHTGYTHQWRFAWAEPFKGVFMASCDSFADYMEASAAGWKTFAVVPKGSTPYSGKLCPATADNSQAQCLTCKLCDGAKTDIFVHAHGVGAAYVQASPVPEPVAA